MGASAQKRSNYNELGNAKLIRKKRSFTMFNYIIAQNLEFVKGFHGNFTKKKRHADSRTHAVLGGLSLSTIYQGNYIIPHFNKFVKLFL